ncbi:MAG: START domain-containing protein [Thalassolituus sp.]
MLKAVMKRAIALIAVVTLAVPAWAGNWEEAKYDKDNDIRVFTRSVKGSDMKAFRGEMIMPSTLTAPIALLQDVDRAGEWVFNCRAMALIEELSDTQALYYTVTEMPWPVMNRDNISETNIVQDAETNAVTVTISARNDVFPENDDHVRIRELVATWTVEPLNDGLVRIVYEAHADPGGGLPSWLVNSFVVDAPLQTLRNMRKLLDDERYQLAQRDYIAQ